MGKATFINSARIDLAPHPKFKNVSKASLITSKISDALSLTRIVLEPGADIFHNRPTEKEDEVIYIIVGEGILDIEGKSEKLKQGTCCLIPAGIVRTVKNTGTVSMELLAIFTPPLE
jgi:mannose-6-phosphate isomerase-like protein (cupin superfamily)